MKLKSKKRKFLQIIILIILITLWTSCTSTPTFEIDALIEITPPSPYDSEGNPLIIYNPDEKVVEMNSEFYFDLMEYIIEIEEFKKLLSN